MIALLHAAIFAAEKKPAANPLITFLPILLIGVVFYFLLIRPQQRKARAQQELTRSTEVGDEVITIGGLFGVIREVDDDSILLEVAPGTELRFLRSAIARKLNIDDEPVEDDVDDEAEHESEHEYIEPDEEFGRDTGVEDKK
jgi:preprotein translocase subunit YajC